MPIPAVFVPSTPREPGSSPSALALAKIDRAAILPFNELALSYVPFSSYFDGDLISDREYELPTSVTEGSLKLDDGEIIEDSVTARILSILISILPLPSGACMIEVESTANPTFAAEARAPALPAVPVRLCSGGRCNGST